MYGSQSPARRGSALVNIRRIPGGSVYVPPDNPFEIDGFGTMGEAAARFASLDGNTFPMMITAPDGQILVIRLRQPEGRQRSAR